MWRTGHSPIKTKMAETGAPLAGEMSGHIFFADRYYGYDDALYAAVRLLDILARGTVGLRCATACPPWSTRPSCASLQRDTEIRRCLGGSGPASPRRREMSDIDGVRVRTAEGWWLLRASNTQDVLVARAEAHDEAGLSRLKALIVDELVLSGIAPPPF